MSVTTVKAQEQEMELVPVKMSVLDSVIGAKAFGTVMERLITSVNRVRTLDRTTEAKDSNLIEAEENLAKYQDEMSYLIHPDNLGTAANLVRMGEVDPDEAFLKATDKREFIPFVTRMDLLELVGAPAPEDS